MGLLEDVQFNAQGLVAAIAQDCETKEVLMLAYMNKESLELTIKTGQAHYFSRSRNQLWLKGETSGNTQTVKEIRYDCDGDALLLFVAQKGGACHTGHRSCFYRNAEEEIAAKVFDEKAAYERNTLQELYGTIVNRRDNPIEGSYTNYLFNKGIDKILKKVGEENAEVIIASKNADKNEIISEVSDLIYHLSVLLVDRGVTWREIFDELDKRAK
jgi:phosphoribosyl-ATP pyrophosphohydrolase/phosphoribosyl-AMP cyclohydrolase